MPYLRVLPRDLFNESKLLKCLGQLSLLIENGKLALTLEHDGEPFNIEQDESNGGLFVTNLVFKAGEHVIEFQSILNGRGAYPLVFIHPVNGVQEVLSEHGVPTVPFLDYIADLIG